MYKCAAILRTQPHHPPGVVILVHDAFFQREMIAIVGEVNFFLFLRGDFRTAFPSVYTQAAGRVRSLMKFLECREKRGEWAVERMQFRGKPGSRNEEEERWPPSFSFPLPLFP